MACIIYCHKCSQYHLVDAQCVKPMTPTQERKWFAKQLCDLKKFEKHSRQAKPIVVK